MAKEIAFVSRDGEVYYRDRDAETVRYRLARWYGWAHGRRLRPLPPATVDDSDPGTSMTARRHGIRPVLPVR